MKETLKNRKNKKTKQDSATISKDSLQKTTQK